MGLDILMSGISICAGLIDGIFWICGEKISNNFFEIFVRIFKKKILIIVPQGFSFLVHLRDGRLIDPPLDVF